MFLCTLYIYLYIRAHSKSLEYVYGWYAKVSPITYCKLSNISFKKCESFFHIIIDINFILLHAVQCTKCYLTSMLSILYFDFYYRYTFKCVRWMGNISNFVAVHCSSLSKGVNTRLAFRYFGQSKIKSVFFIKTGPISEYTFH